MDKNITGRFIAELRKQKGFTQKELAEKLMVTDKAISRWETGKGLPDTSLLKPLGDVLGVSITELLSGKRIEEVDMKEQADNIILESLNYSKRMLASVISVIIFIIGIAFIISPLFLVSQSYIWTLGLIIVAIAIGAITRMDVISNLHIWNGGSPIHLAPEIEVKSRIALPFGFVIPQAVKISAKAYAITTPIRIGMILNIPFPQILKMMITANATKAISQLVDAFWIADGARDKPMQMMIGPVTTGGRKRMTRFTPTCLPKRRPPCHIFHTCTFNRSGLYDG